MGNTKEFDGPLTGTKVLSFAQLAQGPTAVQLMADLGAEVVKVERPGIGAWERSWAGSNAFINGESLFFLGFNRNQRSLTVDLKDQRGKEIIRQLIVDTDVVFENFRPGVMDRLGLGYDALSAINPRIVYCSGTGFGSEGPYRDFAGQDLVLQAESGLAGITGRRQDPPTPAGAPIIDIHAGTLLAFGVVVALLARDRTGLGQRVESSLLEAALHLQMEPLVYFLNGRWLRDRSEEGVASTFHGAPYGIYETADGFLAISMNPLPRLAQVLDLPKLNDYSDEDSYLRPDEIKRLISEVIRTRTTEEWLAIMQPADIWCGVANSYDDLEKHPQIAALGAFDTFDHPTAGEVRVVRSSVRMSGTSSGPMRRPPLLGEHTKEILEDLGYSEEAIRDLVDERVV
ncbi:MAG: CoA transferase [Chloroflexota bacterium]|nr:CoA transferase [Chloroflexota bacterium]